jgi:hypothetical protein
MRQWLLFVVSILFFGGCRHADEPMEVYTGLYYWKSDWYGLHEKEFEYLDMLRPDKLFIKFFEVAPDDNFVGVPVAKSSINVKHHYYGKENVHKIRHSKIIPVVFVQNEVLRDASYSQLDELADNLIFLVRKMFTERMPSGMNFQELQLDCDWTATTRDAYFYLLVKLRELSGKKLSCTLRLYPYKYRQKMGVPPVDRVTLMCYNLLSPIGNDDRNSILESNELEKYLVGVQQYPLPVDVVLPVFSYVHWYQYGQFKGMLRGNKSDIMKHTQPKDGLWHVVTEDFEQEWRYIRMGDMLKVETVDYADVLRTVELLKLHVKFGDELTVSLFHLDEASLSAYEDEELHNLFHAFMPDCQ